MNSEFFNKGLPKWPALLVKGKSVTAEQAKEIIIRTDGLSFSTNDREFSSQLNEVVYGVKSSRWDLTDAIKEQLGITEWNAIWDYQDSKHAEVGVLDITYLNNSQIASSWIGGPHGWCKWDGTIETSNYNIGKWPSVEDVYNDWVIIAEAFPFLNLRSQLMNCEACEDEPSNPPMPVVEFIVKDGKVEMIEPIEQLIPMTDAGWRSLMDPMGERGCTFEQFKDAYEFTKQKINGTNINTSN
jgi:hypothetical protein